MEQNKVSFQNPLTGEPLSQQEIDEMFMRRCLQLAKNGRQNAKPNPMVGAVIVSEEGRIIGEGYHVRCGEGHAEVNAFASVKPEDEHLLKKATIYVSLEPCSHYGKTPPCADLIVRKGVRRCVCGCVDPFAKVQGRGIQKIRGRNRGNSRRSGGGMPRTEQALHHLQYPSATIHHPEMGADCEWFSG